MTDRQHANVEDYHNYILVTGANGSALRPFTVHELLTTTVDLDMPYAVD